MTNWLRTSVVAAVALGVVLGGSTVAVLIADGMPVGEIFGSLAPLAPAMAFVVTGALIADRQPRNLVGWALLFFGVNLEATVFAEEYARTSLAAGGGHLGVGVALWFQTWNWAVGQGVLALTLMHFPNGRLPGRRWRVLRIATIALIAVVLFDWLLVWPVRSDPSLLADTSAFPELASQLQGVVEPLVVLPLLGSVVSLVVRWRRANTIERLQLKWLYLGVAGLAGGLGTMVALSAGPGRGAPLIAELAVLVGLGAIPTAIAIAVLRYRLFDIDRLISRTLAYVALTGTLVGVYALGVLGVGALLPGERSDLVVAGSTLAVAAAFRPLRSRIQAVVDRRFNRARYDAARTLEAFGSRLRDEVDLGSLTAELRDVVEDTVRPQVAAVWLREVPT